MPVQTSYDEYHDASFEGQRTNLGITNITSKVAETGDIPFGRAVVRGTADNQAKLPTATGQGFLGITVMTTAWSENASDLHVYSQYQEMNIIDFGLVWVYTEQSVVPGDDVYFRHTAAASPLDVVGRFRKDASGGDADQIIGAKFETTAAAGALAIVSLRAPGTGYLIAPDSSETLVAAGAASVDTGITYFDSTAGAMAVTLADGVEGQLKYFTMLVDGGDVVVTPTNYANGTTITFNDAFDACALRFTGTQWHLVCKVGNVDGGIDQGIETVTTSTALSLTKSISLIDSTAGALAITLADGVEGQRKTILMTVDGGDAVVTPANYANGTTITLNDANDACNLIFLGTSWYRLNRDGDVDRGPDDGVETVTTSTALSLTKSISLIDSTAGALAITLADGVEGQRKTIIMTVDGGDAVVTPANYANGTTITFNDAFDVCELLFSGTNWHRVSKDGNIDGGVNAGITTITALGAGAVPLTASIVYIDSTLGVQALTLADGAAGQRMTVKMLVDGGDSVIIPANLLDGTTITFDDAGDSAELVFDGTNWGVIGTATATVA